MIFMQDKNEYYAKFLSLIDETEICLEKIILDIE